VFKMCLGLCALMILAGCGAPPTRPALRAPGEALAAPPPGVPLYRIDPAQSEFRLLVYRAGPMAKFGHNHVMVNGAVSGWVAAADGVAGASLALRIPVADFVVDDPQARAGEGADFSEEVAEEARAGTRRNMLSEACLDGERFASISLASRDVRLLGGQPVATFQVTVAGHESNLVVPFALQISSDRVSGSGSIVLRQSDLGLVPFSIMLGALQVQNEITVKFNLVAVKS